MSLKGFITSGIKDVLEGQMNKMLNKNTQPQDTNTTATASPSSSSTNMYPQYGGGGGDQNPSYNPYPQSSYGSQPSQYPQQSPYPPQSNPQVNIGSGATPYPTSGHTGPSPQIGFIDEGNGYSAQPYPGSGYPSQPYPGSGYPPQQQYPGNGYSSGMPNYQPSSQGQAPPSTQQSYPSQQQPYYSQQNPYSSPAQQPYQSFQHQPIMIGNRSIKPFNPFNANQDAEVLRKAMKGLGCNNSKVISVLCARTNWQRQEIAKAFKVMYGKDLIKDLRSELSGDFEDLILALMEPPAIYDAKQLRKAMEGFGTKESVLIEIMTSRTNQQIQEIRASYKQLYGKDLENELIGETSGCFKRLLVSLCAGGRDEGNTIDSLRANRDARKLYKAGEGRLGTDESTFNAILASQNYQQLRMVFEEYQKVANHAIEKAVETEFSGDIRDGLLAVCNVVRSRPAYFAKLLHESMKGLGTRDNDLIRLVVTRCEYDMADIRDAFQAMYKTSLENMIKGDCSGSYKEGLIALVRGN